MSDWLNVISKHHNKWVRTVNSFGEFDFAEDIVQEMYLKLYDMSVSERDLTDNRCAKDFDIIERVIKEDGKCNSTYVWYVLRSIFLDFKREQNKVKKVQLTDIKKKEYINDIEEEHAYGVLLKKVDEEKSKWNRHDVIMFDIYSKQDISMRDIEKNTGIGLRSIFDTIKRCSERLQEALGEDYQDFINKEYERL